jgi:hypothetical protein
MCSLLVLLTALTVRGRFNDPDLWWHLKMGQVIWTTQSLPTHDLFSYTANHQAIIPQEWFAELSIYWAYLMGGYSGVMLWFLVLGAAFVILGYILCVLYSGNAKVAFMGAMIVWFFGTIGFNIRPQMISYTLFALELILVHLGRSRDARWFFLLPPVFLVWINSHASFALGIAVLGVYLICSYMDFELGSLSSHSWEPQKRKMFLWAILLTVAVLFMNPSGLKQIWYPFDTMLNMKSLMANVEEWAPLQLSDARGLGLLAVLFCMFLLVLTRKADLHADELILVCMGSWLAMSHTRMLIIFGMLTAPVFARQLSNHWENYDPEHDRILPNAIIIGLSAIALVAAFPGRQNLQSQVERGNPVKALQFVRANGFAGNMLNDYVFGGYLIWAAPQYPVMIDGRTDVYEWSGFLDEFGRWATLQEDPNLLLKKYDVKFCLLSTQSQMINVVPLLPGWKLAYSDDQARVFVRTPDESAAAAAN